MTPAREGEVAYLPRMLLFLKDAVVGEQVTGFRHVAVGLRWHDGTCVSVQDGAPGGPPSVTSWISVEAAIHGMDAYVCEFNPGRDLGRDGGRAAHSAREGADGLADAVGRVERVAVDLGAMCADLAGAVSAGILADLRHRSGGMPELRDMPGPNS